MKEFKFTVPGNPVAQPRQKHRNVKKKDGKEFVQNYTPKDHPVNAFKASIRHEFSKIYNGDPIEGPVSLRVSFVMVRPKALFKKTKPNDRLVHTKKPDMDNLLKSLKDALNKIAWKDDSQVWDVKATKIIADGDEQPHVNVIIRG